LQPSLALSYNSRNGDGLLGVGWQLAGLSAISRCNLTYAQDGVAGSPQLTSADRFCLDGKRLRTTNSSTYGAPGATYQTEVADFSNITSNGTAGSGPAWFKVQAKSGLTYEYGNTTDSAILASGTNSVRVWALNAVRDRNGNAMTFTYTNDTSNGSYRPASIQYTYTGSSTSNNGYSVVFTYQSRPSADQQWKFTIGGVNNQLNYLSSITVKTVSGSTVTMVHGYELTYVTAPTTSRLRISTIQECASSTSDCFPATSITYQNGATGWGSETAASGNATNLAFALPVDVNGDGIDDLVYADPASGHWYYEIGTTSGAYLGPYDTGIASTNYQSALAIDFYANGRKEILVPNSSSYWRVLKFVSAGAAFTYVDTTTSAAGVVPGSAMVGDIDGDGREDLIYAVSGGSGYGQPDYIYYRLNTGGAFSTTQGTLISFPNGTTCSPCVKLGNSQPFGNPGYRFTSQIRKLDFNGDRRTDFLVYLGTCYPDRPAQCGSTFPITYSWNILLSQPNGTYVAADAVNYSIGTTPGEPPLVGDFDGDGCTDIAYTTTGGAVFLAFGTCGRAGVTNVLASAVGTGVSISGSGPVLAMDWDGDGRTDIAWSNTSSHLVVARSVGNNLSAVVDTGLTNVAGMVADINGDGEEDLIYAASGTALKTRLHAGVKPDLATAFTDAYGVTYSPNYVALAQAASSVYAEGSSQTYPQQDYIGPWYVVPSYTASDGIGGTYTISNCYSAAVVNLQGRGFEGFSGIRANDSRSGIYDFKYYSTVFPTTGLITEDDTLQPGAAKDIRSVTNTVTDLTLDSTTHNQRYFPYTSTSTVKAYELGGAQDGNLITTSVTTYGAPDTYGNFASIETTLTDNDTGSPYLNEQWTTTTATTYTEDHGTNWCLKLPTEVDVTNTAPGVSAITRHVSYTPDYSYCRQTQQVVEPSSSIYKVTTAMGYDSLGNLHSQTVTGVGMAARTTSIDWGISGQFPTLVTNALSQQTHVSFDPSTGKQLGQTDPNNITTSWQYDTFARKIKEIRPDGTSTTWAYNSCATAGCVNTNNKMTLVATWIKTDNSTLTTQNAYLDIFDRTLVTSKLMLNGAYDRNEVQYDNLGRVHQQGFPCTFVGCAAYWTTNTYDILNRITQSQRPISTSNSTLQTTTYSYQGRTSTVTDPQIKVTTQISKVTGSLGRIKDHNGYYINFNHDAFGSVLSVTDSLSNTLNTMTYDYGLQAFQRTSNDADLGPRSATYDALGEVTAYSDAKGQNFSAIYDALSRPTSRTEPDLTSTWTWGNTATSFNIGKLQSVAAASSAGTYSEVYGYDSKTRLSTKQITIPGDTAYTYTKTYNATTGLLDTLQYPVSTSAYQLKLQYGYQNGILQQISDVATGTHYWTANTINPRGQYAQETLGNTVVVNHAFDAVTGWVSSIQAGIGGGAALQNNSYLFDEVGNLTQRQDNNAGVTENVFLDNLYRLDHTVGDSGTVMSYDAIGRISGWGAGGVLSNVNDYTTPQPGCTYYANSQLHAVRKDTNGANYNSYCYDANGNMSAANGCWGSCYSDSFSWTSYNQPSNISNSSNSSQFFYNADHQRYKQIASYNGALETTFYVGGLLEKMINSSGTAYRHYIPVGNNTVVYTRLLSGTNSTYYLTKDHLGSTAIITDSMGNSLVKEKFAALGWNENTPAQQNTMASITRHEFTGHEGLDNLSLVNMNGRIYEPSGSMFLSPDPTIPVPGNTQSYNRYSYVSNNQLTFTDPTGFKQDLPYHGIGEVGSTLGGRGGGGTLERLAHFGFREGPIGNSVAGYDMNDPTDLSNYDGAGSITGFSTGPFAGNGSYAAWVAAGEPISGGKESSKGGSAQSQGSDTAQSQGSDTAQSTPSQTETPGFGSNPDFAGASIDQVSEIDVTAQRTSNSPTISVGNMQIVLDRESYFHIFVFHAWWPITDKSRYYPAFRNVNSINKIFQQTIDSTIGFPEPNANYYFSADLGFFYGTDQSGNPTTWNTVVVEILTQPTVTTPGFGRVVTMYPGQ